MAALNDAPLDIDIRFPVPLERWGAVTYTANCAVNAVPAVCEAPEKKHHRESGPHSTFPISSAVLAERYAQS